ncbi:MAG: shikimate dehydrogenase [Actinomycetota bacterium]|nr:shikimate dehydrogenase [Actinomycetota bacterium]
MSLSLSPAIHNAAFDALGMDWIYLPFGVPAVLLPTALRGLAASGVRGMNVTMPHKIAAMEVMDDISEAAAKIGAINTVEVRGDMLVGHNTDGEGLIRFLRVDVGADLAFSRALVLGAGGAARAAVVALAGAGVAEIWVVSRDAAKAAALEPLAAPAIFHSGSLDEGGGHLIGEADVIINATPLGQKREEPAVSPEKIRKETVVVDLVYKPPVTPLIEAARAQGAVAHSGLGMLLHQAALSFQIWTGAEPPMETMSAAGVAELSDPEVGQDGAAETV